MDTNRSIVVCSFDTAVYNLCSYNYGAVHLCATNFVQTVSHPQKKPWIYFLL